MSKTRNNHYVPQWYQKGFFEPNRNTLAYLNLAPSKKSLNDGRVITEKAIFESPTSRAFRQTDLYTTFFGASPDDEIERRLFGDIDRRGSKAVRAFTEHEIDQWHLQCRTLFEYIDTQKIRTPKGLDWLKAQYPMLTQNELMFEMQGIRMLHCTIWAEGVREIVSAEEADVKFIISDHPVTIYNHSAQPEVSICTYPHDPSIALKASQTIFPLSRDYCLIFTNLEYAKDPSTNPLEKRTFPRNYRSSMVRTDAFIRTRKLTGIEVTRINHILKQRARRYVAAGCEEWLYPETIITEDWAGLRNTLLPPENELLNFGGEMYVKFEDGHTRFQDAFGRTEKERDFLQKDLSGQPPRPGGLCGCGSGKKFRSCCKFKPVRLRPTWEEASIRERNIMLYNGIVNILGLEQGINWVSVRRELTDEKIAKIYRLYEALWPLESDLLRLLPKPDGVARAVYTGIIHPMHISKFALGSSLYFGELLIEHPFLHAGIFKKEFNPVENPKAYRQEFLKTLLCFLSIMPLVESGFVNLIPDLCNFDEHLRNQMLHMAENRVGEIELDIPQDASIEEFIKQDTHRGIVSLPREALRSQLSQVFPEMDNTRIEETLRGLEQLKEQDPLVSLQEDPITGENDGGQFIQMKLAPNFEMAMYLAQATGSCIVTDNALRWKELCTALYKPGRCSAIGLSTLAHNIKESIFSFPQNVEDIEALSSDKDIASYPSLMRDLYKYLSKFEDGNPKPNYEQNLTARFGRMHSSAQAVISKAQIHTKEGRIHCTFPAVGIQDNTVNRLLLMSSSEMHLANVPMAFFIEDKDS